MCVACVQGHAEPIKITLQSAAMLHAPGFLLACMNDYRIKNKTVKARALKWAKSCWQNDAGFPSDDVFKRLLSGEIPYTTVKAFDEKAKMELEHVEFTV